MEEPCKADACRLLIFCGNQTEELTPLVCAVIGKLFSPELGSVIINFGDFLKPFARILITLRHNRHKAKLDFVHLDFHS